MYAWEPAMPIQTTRTTIRCLRARIATGRENGRISRTTRTGFLVVAASLLLRAGQLTMKASKHSSVWLMSEQENRRTVMKPMLAAKADPNKFILPMTIQAKLDGIRCVIVDGKPLSRTLKEIPNREIFEALSNNPYLEGLDGELVVGDPTADDAYRKTTSYVMAHEKTGGDWTFWVFDRHDSNLPFDIRYEEVSRDTPIGPHIKVLSSITVDNADELNLHEEQAVSQGFEGLILRGPNSLYKYGRGTVKAGDLLKLKRFVDFEATITGVFEEMYNGNEAKTNALGRTERSSVQANKVGKGTLGGFVVEALNGDLKGVEFRVGTGFTAEHRADFWRDQDNLIGAVVKVKCFPVGVKEKPRHPVFLGFRNIEIDG